MKQQYQTRCSNGSRKLPEMADRLHPARRIWGVCHPNIYYFHNLTPGWVSFNAEKPEIAIIPEPAPADLWP